MHEDKLVGIFDQSGKLTKPHGAAKAIGGAGAHASTRVFGRKRERFLHRGDQLGNLLLVIGRHDAIQVEQHRNDREGDALLVGHAADVGPVHFPLRNDVTFAKYFRSGGGK